MTQRKELQIVAFAMLLSMVPTVGLRMSRQSKNAQRELLFRG
jgi:hypothetical protein